MGFKQLKDLARRGFLPIVVANDQQVKYPAYQQGKAIKSKSEKKKKIAKDSIVLSLGDLMHMDQAESSTPGRPLTNSGKNNKKKIFIVSLFVDSISKDFFCEF